MGYGFEVYNSTGNLTISENYQNYHLSETGAVAHNGAMPIAASGELIFVRPSALGGRITVGVSTNGLTKLLTSSSGATNFVKTRLNPTPTAETHGLRVLTSAGGVAFDSSRRGTSPIALGRASISSSWQTWVWTINLPAVSAGKTRYIPLNTLDAAYGLTESGTPHFGYFLGPEIEFVSDIQIKIRVAPTAMGPWIDGGFVLWQTDIIIPIIDV